MVTQEEIETRLAGGILRAQAEGRAQGLADVESVMRKKRLSEKLIAEIQAELKVMSQERQTQERP